MGLPIRTTLSAELRMTINVFLSVLEVTPVGLEPTEIAEIGAMGVAETSINLSSPPFAVEVAKSV